MPNNNNNSFDKVQYYRMRLSDYKSGKLRRNVSFGFTIVGFVLSVLLLVSVIGALRGNGNYLTFQGLLDILGDTYYVPIDWIFSLNTVTNIDWGFYVGKIYISFNFLKVLYNMFVPIIQVVLYLATGIVQVLIFAISFIRILFGY